MQRNKERGLKIKNRQSDQKLFSVFRWNNIVQVLEARAETDFVAKNQEFINFVAKSSKELIASDLGREQLIDRSNEDKILQT